MMIAKTAMLRRGVGRCSPAAALATHKRSGTLIRFQSSASKPSPNGASSSASSLLNSAAEYYSSLRWKVAASLTESLPKDQQKELLGRLNILPPPESIKPEETNAAASPKAKEIELETQNSIAEAVAAARAEEAKKQKEQWETQSAKLVAEAEEAARKRIENELLIQHRRMAFEKWQHEVNQQSSSEAAASSNGEQQHQQPAKTQPTEATKEIQKKDTVQQTIPTVAEEPFSVADHPVLGPSVADLGYKRVHIASVATLKSLPVWKKQRTYRHNRAKAMATDKLKTLHLGMPGIIALHEDVNGKLSIIDGQHRVGMMAILEETKENSKKDADFFDLQRILVEVYPEVEREQDGAVTEEDSTSAHAQEIFMEINKAEPVKLVDLPGMGLTQVARKTINEGAKRLEDAFPDMFSASQRCRSPHLNIDNLRDALFASEVLKKHDLKSPKALEAWMMERNESLKKEYIDSSSKKATSVSSTALKKAIKHNFFLGLDSSWLYI